MCNVTGHRTAVFRAVRGSEGRENGRIRAGEARGWYGPCALRGGTPNPERDVEDEKPDGTPDERREDTTGPAAVREEDVHPYVPLLQVARLFRFAAKVVAVALVFEVIAGISLEGSYALLPLIAEVIRGIILAAVLWGVGDLTTLLVGVGGDARAARVLLGRISARTGPAGEESRRPPAGA